MCRMLSAVLIIVLFFSISCTNVLDSDDNGNTPNYTFYQLDMPFEDGNLQGYISIPNSAYDTSAVTPLILALHWGDVNPYKASLQFLELFLPPFQKLEPIIISPACPTNSAGGWNSDISERALLTLLDSANVWYPVDPELFAITGYSMGGSGTWNFITKYPDIFSAAIPVASLPPESLPAENDYPAITVVHGTADEFTGISTVRSRVEGLKSEGININLIEAVGKSHYMTTQYTSEMDEAVTWLKGLWSQISR